MPCHDYICDSCGDLAMDRNVKPDSCSQCGSQMRITYSYWKDINYGGNDELTDSKGFRKRFRATEDPTCMIEVGLAQDNGIATFSEEQRQHYAGKILADGDTPQLRREILRQRSENLKNAGIDGPEVM